MIASKSNIKKENGTGTKKGHDVTNKKLDTKNQ